METKELFNNPNNDLEKQKELLIPYNINLFII